MRDQTAKFETPGMLEVRRVTTQERLKRMQKDLEEQLQKVKEAVELFDKHPYLAQAVDLLGELGI